jgi:translation initiation factor RLI1
MRALCLRASGQNRVPHLCSRSFLLLSPVMKPMNIEDIIDQEVKNLSGGELQRVAIVLALGKPADIYLIDEPSAYLDSEQRIVTAKVIKRFILHARKTAFIVEHDFIMATYLADRVIVYTGLPAIDCVCNAPQSLLSGMNAFLKDLAITFRRDPTNHRPRINKLNSVKDKEQKSAGTFFYLDTDDEVGDGLTNKADKKKADKLAEAAAKETAKETKKLQDKEKAEAARLAAEDEENAK